MENINEVCNKLIEWLKEKVDQAGCKGVVFGLSGGIDSAVVAALSKKAFPENSLGIIMPCHSQPQDEEHARLLADTLDLSILKVDLTETFETLRKEVKDDNSNKLANSNIKPRLRMTTLYYFAQMKNYLVVGPSNKSEFTTGYFTKHGDSGVDILPIADFVKEEIYELARHLGVNDEIINKPPSAGLWENQTDEDEMGFGYSDLDKYIKTGEGKPEIVSKIKRMNKISEHKRQFPPIFKK